VSFHTAESFTATLFPLCAATVLVIVATGCGLDDQRLNIMAGQGFLFSPSSSDWLCAPAKLFPNE